MADFRGKIALNNLAKNTAKQLSNLRKHRDRIDSKEGITDKERDEQLREIERKQKVIVGRFNKKWAMTGS